METKHTKGEWYVNPRASLNVKCGEKTIASCSSSQSGENLEEEQANAKLIAAAPELLEALIKLNDYFFCEKSLEEGEYQDLINITQNALKKATI